MVSLSKSAAERDCDKVLSLRVSTLLPGLEGWKGHGLEDLSGLSFFGVLVVFTLLPEFALGLLSVFEGSKRAATDSGIRQQGLGDFFSVASLTGLDSDLFSIGVVLLALALLGDLLRTFVLDDSAEEVLLSDFTLLASVAQLQGDFFDLLLFAEIVLDALALSSPLSSVPPGVSIAGILTAGVFFDSTLSAFLDFLDSVETVSMASSFKIDSSSGPSLCSWQHTPDLPLSESPVSVGNPRETEPEDVRLSGRSEPPDSIRPLWVEVDHMLAASSHFVFLSSCSSFSFLIEAAPQLHLDLLELVDLMELTDKALGPLVSPALVQEMVCLLVCWEDLLIALLYSSASV